MRYIVKCSLKVEIHKIYRVIFVGVICVYDLGKEIVQARQAVTCVSEAISRVTYQVDRIQVCD